MRYADVVRHVRSLVEEACRRPTNPFGYGIWQHHILSVVRYAKLLAEERGADEEIVELAALLHDYASITRGLSAFAQHHLLGAEEAERILSNLNYPTDRIQRVKECILSHRGSTPPEPATIEAQCVADADALSHFDSLSSLFHYAYRVVEMREDEAVEWIRAKLERSWRKLSPEAKALARAKYEACRLLLGKEKSQSS